VARSLSILCQAFQPSCRRPKICTRCPAFSAKLSRVSLATSLSCPALSLVGLVKGPCPNILPKRLCAVQVKCLLLSEDHVLA
jgi:hypothetical protein